MRSIGSHSTSGREEEGKNEGMRLEVSHHPSLRSIYMRADSNLRLAINKTCTGKKIYIYNLKVEMFSLVSVT